MTSNYWTRHSMTRRTLLRGAGVGIAGLAGAALIGCGEDEEAAPVATSTSAGDGGTGTASAPTTSEVKYGGTLRASHSADPRGLDPHISVGGSDIAYSWLMTDGVVSFNREGIPDPERSLAEQWELADDGATIVFTLREGIKFHDGSDLDAELVKANFERVLDPATNSTASGAMAPIQNIEVIDSKTVRVQLDAPNAAFLTLLGDRGGQVLARAYLEGEIVGQGDKVIGTGPFIYDRWERDSMLRVVKNPNYWRKDAAGNVLPYVDAIELRTIPDANVSEATFQSGDVDMFTPGLDRVSQYENGATAGTQLVEFRGINTQMLFTNTTLAPMDDVRFRKAIAHAIDREAENQALYFGRYTAEERPGPFPPAYAWLYSGSIPNAPKFDLAEAKKFLDASNYAGNPKFEQLSGTGASSDERNALYTDFLAQIGIEMVSTQSRDSNPFYVDRTVPGRTALLTMRADPDGFASELFSSNGYYNPGRNEGQPDLQAMDQVLAEARATYDPEERKARYQRLSEMASDFVVQVYGTYATNYQVGSDKIGNLGDYYSFDGRPRWGDLWLA